MVAVKLHLKNKGLPSLSNAVHLRSSIKNILPAFFNVKYHNDYVYIETEMKILARSSKRSCFGNTLTMKERL